MESPARDLCMQPCIISILLDVQSSRLVRYILLLNGVNERTRSHLLVPAAELCRYFLASTLVAVGTIYHALVTREQFYPAMVYLSSSKLSIAVLSNVALCILYSWQRLITRIFFGNLRDAEVERVTGERPFPGFSSEVCRFRSEPAPSCRCRGRPRLADRNQPGTYHVPRGLYRLLWRRPVRAPGAQDLPLADRGPGRLPGDPAEHTGAHARAPGLLHVSRAGPHDRKSTQRESNPSAPLRLLLSTVDVMLLTYAVRETRAKGASVLILFGFEYLILLTSVVSSAFKYGLSVVNTAREGRWEEKALYVFYLELVRARKAGAQAACFEGRGQVTCSFRAPAACGRSIDPLGCRRYHRLPPFRQPTCSTWLPTWPSSLSSTCTTACRST